MTKPTVKISHLVVLGDSLSDRGTLDKRELLGFIPMSYLSGLHSKSPRGRFTNGFLWGDYVSATTVEQFEINAARRKLKLDNSARSNADIGDELLTNRKLLKKDENAFSLNQDKHVLYNGERFARFYCEGGLTAHDYKTSITLDPTKEASRLILATLEEKRALLLKEDKKYAVSKHEKAETLVVEWSGANDLITVNEEPTYREADNAVSARIANVEQLIQKGYRNFVLFNLPNLALTPRYQAKNKAQQDNAAASSKYFNQQLAAKCQELNEKYGANLSVFDVSGLFEEVYHNPEKYDFDKDKLTTPYTTSAVFKENENNPVDKAEKISPAKGYMFWDDVHPTETMHNWLAEKFQDKYNNAFEFVSPEPIKLKAHEEADIALSDEKVVVNMLPEDVLKILNKLHKNAESMCKSRTKSRREKGELLKNFVFDVKSKCGCLEDVHELISAFKMDDSNMKIIKKHNNRIYDFFARKKTTRSEDDIAALEQAIIAQIGPRV